MQRSRVPRVGRETATLVWMLASLVLMVVATTQVFTGIRLAFSIEWVSPQDSTDFFTGEDMIRTAYLYFALMAGIALLLVPRRWWVWLGFAMPAVIFCIFSFLVSTDASAVISFLGLVAAVIVDLVEIPFSIVRLVHAVRQSSPKVPATA